jgi:hypothetical protein
VGNRLHSAELTCRQLTEEKSSQKFATLSDADSTVTAAAVHGAAQQTSISLLCVAVNFYVAHVPADFVQIISQPLTALICHLSVNYPILSRVCRII